jgi:hypothetical protein
MSASNWITIIFIVVMIVLVGVNGCTNEPEARRVLQNAGYSSITFTGWEPFACGEGDWYRTGFSAKNPVGNYTSGVVCSGLFLKNSTIRYN